MSSPPTSTRPHLATVPLAPVRGRDDPARLPAPLSSLVGREREVAAVAALLGDPAVRLVTLTGPGGVGKTRLATAVAAGLAEGSAFADGVAFVALAAVADPELVGSTIAQALGVRLTGGRTAPHHLASALHASRLVLVLDNFEQVLPAAPLVAEILVACPKVKALVTSRERLRLTGEHAVPVAPLAVPAPGAAVAAADLAAIASVRLFVQRAREASPSFAFADADAAAVAAICARLDGLPLAIELAAARVAVLPPRALLARLDSPDGHRLPLLTGGPRDAPARQQTLRNAIAWSYDLLSPDEQALFRRLAVFAGGCTLDAAEVVGRGSRVEGEASVPSTLDFVALLVDASLLRREADPDETARYRMLETVREFAEERLAASDEAAAVRRAHAAYFLSFAARNQLAELLPDGDQVVARLEAEHANLRAALAWLEEAGERGSFLRLAAALGRFWSGQLHYQEGRGWLERALEHGGGAAADRAQAIVLLGIIESYQGANREAEARLTEGLAACREVGDALHAAYALLFLGALAAVRGDRTRATALLEETLAAAQVVTDQRLAGILTSLALINLAVADRLQGNRTLATARLEDALRLVRDAGYTRGTILALEDLGDLARDEGDYARALGFYREALGLGRGSPGTRQVIDAIAGVAMVAAAAGQVEQGARLLGAAEALCDRIGYRYRTADNIVAYEHAVATARAALGEPAFATAWAARRDLRPAQAVAEALATIEAPAAAPGAILTPREAQILPLLAAGRTDREIGAALFLSSRTVGNHVTRLMAKLGVHTRADAVETARAKGLLPPAE